MRKYILIVLVFFYFESSAQDQKFENFKFEAGIQIPLGNLANKYGFSEEIGVYYRSKLPFDDVLDLGFKFYFPNEKHDFTYFARDSAYVTKVKDINLTILGKVNKHYNLALV